MYIKDEHPMRSRVRYVSTGGIGIGPELVVPVGTPVRLQQSTPPLNGLMVPMVQAYPTLVPTMAPLPCRADFAEPLPPEFDIPPVEMIEPTLVEDDAPLVESRGMGTCLSCR
jgi:hypothetical protein